MSRNEDLREDSIGVGYRIGELYKYPDRSIMPDTILNMALRETGYLGESFGYRVDMLRFAGSDAFLLKHGDMKLLTHNKISKFIRGNIDLLPEILNRSTDTFSDIINTFCYQPFVAGDEKLSVQRHLALAVTLSGGSGLWIERVINLMEREGYLTTKQRENKGDLIYPTRMIDPLFIARSNL